MKFFDREKETEYLREINELSKENAQFTVLTGRRRVGKTWLVTHAYDPKDMLYFFVGRKSETELSKGFAKEIEEKLHLPVLGAPEKFSDIFEFLMKYSQSHPITLFIDEFQDFIRVNKSIFSDMQRIWDLYKENSKMNLIVGGSIYSLISKIFKDEKEPLYGRQSRFLRIKPFRTSVIKDILSSYNPDFLPDDLLTMYMLTGGVAKYVSSLMDNKAYTSDSMIVRAVSEDSPFISEGKNILLEEFGKDSAIYFSILSAIASGRNTRNEIETAVGKEVGGYLTKLEDEYNLVTKHLPVLTPNSQKNVHYELDDMFFKFWFRFIHKYNYMLEIGKYDKLREVIHRDYNTYSGHVLEHYFKHKLAEEADITRLGNWWDRKGENEIDIITENELDNRLTFYEVKRQRENISIGELKAKAEAFFTKNKIASKYDIEYKGLTLEDM
ncbi:MAG: ATP-binding protein [Muribaculaceae bacterium]|nr:ATP-binding protein [Muribaculaceae bacterium]